MTYINDAPGGNPTGAATGGRERARQPVPAGPQAGTSWNVVLVLVLAGLLVAFQVGKLVAALPTVSADLGIGLVLGGVILGGFNLVAALSGATLGVVTGRLGTERILVLGLLLVAAASILGGTVTTGPLLLLTTVAEGAGFVAVVVAAPSLITRATRPDDATLALGIWSTYMPAGQAIMILVAPLLLGVIGWRGLWQLNAAMLAVCAVLAWRLLGRRRLSPVAEQPAGHDVGLRHDLATALRTPGPRLLTLIFGGYALQFMALTGFLPTVYGTRGLGAIASTAATSAVIAANVIGNLTAGILLRRGTPRWALIAVATTVMSITAVGVFTLDLPFAITYGCAVAFSAVGGLLPAAAFAGVPVLTPHQRLIPVTNGLLIQGIGLGMLVGPVAAGTLAYLVGGWQATPLVVSTTAACVLLLALRLRRHELAA